MDRIEILKKAKEKVDALVAEQREAEAESVSDEKAFDVALDMARHDALIEAISNNYTSPEEIGRIFADAVSQITVKVPEVQVPEVKIPEIKVPEANVTVNVPEIKLPTINVPEPKVTVNVPELKIPPFPEIKMPESMEVHGDVGLFGYGFDNPLPVQLRDANGNPVSLPDMMSVASGGGGPRFVKINNTASEPIPITGNITSTPGATYYASDAIGSVNIVQSIPLDVSISGATGTLATNIVDSTGVAYSGSNPLPVDITQDVNVAGTVTANLAPTAISATTVDATASGDTTIVSITNTPRLYYISLSANGANSADVTALVKIGATSKYKVSLKAGAIWARNIGAGNSYVTGASGEDIVVNLSAAQTVHVSVEYADV